MIKLSPPKAKLGHIWRYCNFAIGLSKKMNEEVAVCTQAYPIKGGKFVDKSELIQEVLENLSYDVKISTHTDVNSRQIPDMYSCIPYCNTKVTWSIDKVTSFRIAHQLDGDDISKWFVKHIDDVRYFNKIIQDKVALSNKYTIAEIVEIMSSSFLFIGADSGISHIAHSVGIPTFILGDKISQNITNSWHHGNKFELVSSLTDFTLEQCQLYFNNLAKYQKLGEKYGNNRQHPV